MWRHQPYGEVPKDDPIGHYWFFDTTERSRVIPAISMEIPVLVIGTNLQQGATPGESEDRRERSRIL